MADPPCISIGNPPTVTFFFSFNTPSKKNQFSIRKSMIEWSYTISASREFPETVRPTQKSHSFFKNNGLFKEVTFFGSGLLLNHINQLWNYQWPIFLNGIIFLFRFSLKNRIQAAPNVTRSFFESLNFLVKMWEKLRNRAKIA